MRWIDEQMQGKVAYKFGDRIMPHSRKKSLLLCPTCGATAKLVCMCHIADHECDKGHRWHLRYEDGKAFVAQGEGVH